MHKEINSVDFAIYLSQKAEIRGMKINVTKIQKWLYMCYDIYLAMYKKQLLSERSKASEYGPVFTKVQDVQMKCSHYCLSDLRCKTDMSKYDGIDEIIRTDMMKH